MIRKLAELNLSSTFISQAEAELISFSTLLYSACEKNIKK